VRQTLRILSWACLFLAISAWYTPAEEVVLQLRWAPQFQFAGYYAADWQGYYEDVGISVEIRSALHEDDILSAVDQVLLGEADFGIGGAEILSRNEPDDSLVVVASILQESPAALYSLADTELDSPDDLLSVTRARVEDGLIDIEIRAMMLLEGLDPDGGSTVPLEPGIGQLLTGEADVVSGYQITAPWVLREAGIEYNELRPSSYGVKFYGDSIFTTAELAAKDPELVARFRDASLRGWEYAFDNAEEVSREVAALDRSQDPLEDPIRFNLWQAQRMRALALYPAVEIGHINRHRWDHMQELLSTLGIVSGRLDLDSFVFDPGRLLAEKRRRTLLILLIGSGILLLGAAIAATWALTLRREVRKRTQALREAVSQRDRLLKEMNHRVKNNLAMVRSLLRLKNSETDSESDLSGVLAQVGAIAKVHELLSEVEGAVEVPARAYIRQVVTSSLESARPANPEVLLDVENVDLPSKTAVTLGLVLSELATNAAKYGFEPEQRDPRFTVRFLRDAGEGYYLLSVSNNGRRFPEGVGPPEGSTLGLSLVHDLIAQLGGDITLSRDPITSYEIAVPIET
jgi:two-component sensor histidine kinase/ABC-type nitrate/sulfonate/bicarbonate transport system substrate-binding protein